MKNFKEHLIVSTDATDYNFDDFKKQMIEVDKEALEPLITDNDVIDFICSEIDNYFVFLREELNKELNGKIIQLASVGTYRGRRRGVNILNGNLRSILYAGQGDFYKLYYTAQGVYARDIHHDGTNYYEFREIKDGVNIDNYIDKFLAGKDTARDKTRYTKSLVKELIR